MVDVCSRDVRKLVRARISPVPHERLSFRSFGFNVFRRVLLDNTGTLEEMIEVKFRTIEVSGLPKGKMRKFKKKKIFIFFFRRVNFHRYPVASTTVSDVPTALKQPRRRFLRSVRNAQ